MGSRGAASPARSVGFTVHGVTVDRVMYHHQLISVETYENTTVAADAKHGVFPHLIVDRSATTRGYLVAYDTVAEADRYTSSHHMGVAPVSNATHVSASTGAHKGASPSSLNGVAAQLATCSLPNHVGWFYDGTDCTSSTFGIGYTDSVPSMSTYGWDNKASSVALGNCISGLTVWNSDKYTGASTSFGGSDVYTSMPIVNGAGFNNSISSYKTTKSAAC